MTRRDETRRDETRQRISALGFVSLLGVACAPSGDREPLVAARTKLAIGVAPAMPARSLWYDPATTTQDLGLVLSGTDVGRSHIFLITNIANHQIKVRGVENQKPCCGDVARLVPTDLEPGQVLAVPVTIKLGLGSGQVVHRAVIEVEGDDPVNLTTTERAQARATLTAVEPPVGAAEIGQSGYVEFLIQTFGVADDPPRPLDDSAIRCGLATEWVGLAPTEVVRNDSIIEVQRLVRVILPAARDFGRQRAELEVLGVDGTVIGRSQICWEVAPTLVTSPSGLIFGVAATKNQERKIVVRSRDDQPFRITETTTQVPGLVVEADDVVALSHTIQARWTRVDLADSQTGEVVIATDHPTQSTVKIAVYIPAASTSSSELDFSRSKP